MGKIVVVLLLVVAAVVLVGGFNPFEKYARQNGFIFPNFRGENSKKSFKMPPPSVAVVVVVVVVFPTLD